MKNAFNVYVNGPLRGIDKTLGYAGNYELDINGVSQAGSFGNIEKNEFERVRGENLWFSSPTFPYDINGEEKISVEVKWTIYRQQPFSVVQDVGIPESLMIRESLSVVGKAMMADVSTADLTIKCGAEIFRVHKVFLCYR